VAERQSESSEPAHAKAVADSEPPRGRRHVEQDNHPLFFDTHAAAPRRAIDLSQLHLSQDFPKWRMRQTSIPARCLQLLLLAAAALGASSGPLLAAPQSPLEMAAEYRVRVDRRLEVPADEARRYAQLTEATLQRAGAELAQPQWLFVVDRNPWVQASLLFWRSAAGEYAFAGASPVSTGRPGTFDHFDTPLGVFPHTPANPDYRAEGTFNENGIRGYGIKGMRVFDFGWQSVPKGWGDGNVIQMRLRVHATDPDALEQRLGSAQSKGCIRIPATLNRFLDHYGILDAEYERHVLAGHNLWVLGPDREPAADAGSHLVVIDSQRDGRAEWSPAPYIPHRAPTALPPPPPPPPKPPGQPAFPIRR
jgi:hypothetical protein